MRSQRAGFGSSSTSIDSSVVTRCSKDHRTCVPAAAERVWRELSAHARRHIFRGCQMRGGRKGGLPGCEANGLAASGIAMLAKAEGNTMIDDAAPTKLKHFSAQVAMAAQSSMAFAHGSAL